MRLVVMEDLGNGSITKWRLMHDLLTTTASLFYYAEQTCNNRDLFLRLRLIGDLIIQEV
jgi:hypothetical protein